jgi:hypothetical protein
METTMVAAPLSETELRRRADLVVDARVVSRTGDIAQLYVTSFRKGRIGGRGWLGRLGLARTLEVSIHTRPEFPILGDWWNEGAFVPGYRIRAWLGRIGDGDVYEAVWWNAVEIMGKDGASAPPGS